MFVTKAAIDSYNNGVRDGFVYGFLSGIVAVVIAKAIKIVTKNKAVE